MAVLGFGNYRCEAYCNFNADGLDGSHPYCIHQLCPKRVTDECRMFKLGIPFGYEAGGKYRAERAHEVAEMLNEKEGL